LTATTKYYVAVSGTNYCENAKDARKEVVVTVNPKPALNNIPATLSVCSGSKFQYTPASTPSGTITWSRAAVSGIVETAKTNQYGGIDETLTNTTTGSITVSYVFSITANDCSNTQTVNVDVKPTPALTSPTAHTVCSEVQVDYHATSSLSGTTFAWERTTTALPAGVTASGGNSGNTEIITETLTNTGNVPASVNYRFTLTKDGCSTEQTVTVTVNPTLKMNPVGDVEVCSGGAVGKITFGTSITSPAVTYSWSANNTDVGLPLSGTGDIDAFTAVTNTTGSAKTTVVTVTPHIDACFVAEANKQTFTVTVKPALTAGAIVANSSTICNGDAPTFVLTPATGGKGSITYKWYKSADNGSTWTDETPGETYPYGALLATTTFKRTATDDCGSIATSNVTITVFDLLQAGAAGAAQTVCYGEQPAPLLASTAPSGGTGSYTRQWQANSVSGDPASSDWTDISGANSDTYQPPTLAADMYYRLAITSGACGTVYTPAVKITVNPEPTVAVAGVPTEAVCHDAQIGDITFSGTATKYKWKITSGDAATLGLVASEGEIAGNPAILHFPQKTSNTGSSDRSVEIEATPFYTDDCPAPAANRQTFTVAVTPALTAGAIVANRTICYGDSPGDLNVQPASGGKGTVIYQWQYFDGSVWTNVGNETTSPSWSPAALQTTTKYRRVAKDDCNADKISNEATITVHDELQAGATGAAQTVCRGAQPAPLATAAAPSGGTGSYTRQWQANSVSGDPASSDWTDVSGANSDTYQPPTLTADMYYRLAITSGDCGTVYTPAVKITVNPEPAVAPLSDISVCHGDLIPSVNLNGSPSGDLAFSWEVISGEYSAASLSSPSGSATSITFGNATNLSGSPKYVEIKATPKIASMPACEGAADTFLITVNPKPSVDDISDTTVCHNTSVSIPVSGTATEYEWEPVSFGGVSGFNTVRTSVGGMLDLGTLTSDSYGVPQSVTVRVTPYYDNCVAPLSEQKEFKVTVNPLATASMISVKDTAICYGGAATLTASASTVFNPRYRWYANKTDLVPMVNGDNETYTTGTLTADAVYYVSVFGDEYCENLPANRREVHVKVHEIPSATQVPPQTVCHGDSLAKIVLSGSPAGDVTFSWTSNNNAAAGLSDGSGSEIEFGKAVNSGDAPIDVIVEVRPKIASKPVCVDAPMKFTVTVYPKPSAGTVTGAETICIDEETPPLIPSIAGGRWRSDDESKATVTAAGGVVTGKSEGATTIWYIVESAFGCRDSVSHTITVKSGGNSDYSDVRLFVCPSVGEVDLSKYIDTVGVKSISWSPSGSLLTANGVLHTANIRTSATYTFSYTVTAGCNDTTLTRKVYVKTLRQNETPHTRTAISICHERAQTVQINQIIGLEAGGTISYDPALSSYISETSYGGTLFDGAKYYADNGNSGVKQVTFSYTAPNSCLPEGKIYSLTVTLTPS
jgi:hypothetical protein